MKKCTRILSTAFAILILTMSLLSALSIPVFAAEENVGVSTIPADCIWKQQTNYTCTLASEVMIMRYASHLLGKSYSHITESDARKYLWCENAGIWCTATYRGSMTFTAESWSGKSTAQKKSALIAMLKSHPEGILIYNGIQCHAVVVIGYINGQFLVIDPAPGKSSGAIPITSAYKFSNGVADITKVWFLKSPDIPAPHVCSSSSAATCTTDQICDGTNGCGKVLQEKLGHDYTDTVIEANCTDTGYTKHTCTRCNHTYVDGKTAEKGHTPGAEATCTAPQTCTVCSAILAEKTPHKLVLSSTVVEPTCTEGGQEEYICTHCNTTKIKDIPPLGHVPGSPATCLSAQTCSVCDAILADQLHGHEYSVTFIPASCDRPAVITRECDECGVTQSEDLTEEFPPLCHPNRRWIETVAPSVGVEGQAVLYCSDCLTVFEVATIPALTEPSDTTETDSTSDPLPGSEVIEKESEAPTPSEVKPTESFLNEMGCTGTVSASCTLLTVALMGMGCVAALKRNKKSTDNTNTTD